MSLKETQRIRQALFIQYDIKSLLLLLLVRENQMAKAVSERDTTNTKNKYLLYFSSNGEGPKLSKVIKAAY